MNKLTKNLLMVSHLSLLSEGDSLIHLLHPLVKIGITFFMILVILTSSLGGLLLCFLLILFLIYLSKINFFYIFRRTWIGLPFSFFMGISQVILDRAPLVIAGITITNGFFTMMIIVIRTILCLSTVFLLMATTPFNEIIHVLAHLKIPETFLLIITMTYRYIFLLVEEASVMTRAYLLRHPEKDSLEMRHMGSFIGSLLIRSLHKGENIGQSMMLRGYQVHQSYMHMTPLKRDDYFFCLFIVGVLILIKGLTR